MTYLPLWTIPDHLAPKPLSKTHQITILILKQHPKITPKTQMTEPSQKRVSNPSSAKSKT